MHRSSRFLPLLMAGLLLGGLAPRSATAQVSKGEIDAMVKKAADYLHGEVSKNSRHVSAGGYRSLTTYALAKSITYPTSDPLIQKLAGEIQAKVNDKGNYKPLRDGYYEAGIDIMALEAIGGKKYLKEIQAIVDYLVSHQNENGSWAYPNDRDTPVGKAGDTSTTQYAVLGFWTAAEIGANVPRQVLEKAARWHMQSQLGNGGWLYRPLEKKSQVEGATHTMGVAGTGSLLLIRRTLFPSAKPFGVPGAKNEDDGKDKKFGVLDQNDLDNPTPGTGSGPSGTPTMKIEEIDRTALKGLRWVGSHFTFTHTEWPMYNLYGIERMGSLANVQTLGGSQWFYTGAQLLRKTQQADGTWRSNRGNVAGTSFGILFLRRATGKKIGKAEPEAGTGLMVGGRGLPENLGEITMKDGEVKTQKVDGPLDQLLADLAKADSLGDAEAAQEAIIEQVQLGDREKLIGEKERLLKLVEHPSVEVRRTSVWALGRCEDLNLVPTIIKALDDPDLSVAVEARNALCILTRQPEGLGGSSEPLAGVEDADENTKVAAAVRWRKDVISRWRGWYQRMRPYEERDDIDELIKLNN